MNSVSCEAYSGNSYHMSGIDSERGGPLQNGGDDIQKNPPSKSIKIKKPRKTKQGTSHTAAADISSQLQESIEAGNSFTIRGLRFRACALRGDDKYFCRVSRS